MKEKRGSLEKTIKIDINSISLEGTLNLPEPVKAVVVFAHGSGSSRFSPRNNFVANVLQKAGLGTLLFDLLTKEEDSNYENRFNITLLAERLIVATKWLNKYPQIDAAKIGFFGASTGAAAALQAAVVIESISAIVSRGGRPDLALPHLPKVKAATLLIVGGYDTAVIDLNRQAYDQLHAEKKLVIIPRATHLFEEPGALEEVARLAKDWFITHLVKSDI